MATREEARIGVVGAMYDAALQFVEADYHQDQGKQTPYMRRWNELSDGEREVVTESMINIVPALVRLAVGGA